MKFLACFLKDALVLVRDKAGLLLLFLMPTALVLIVTLVQEDSFRVVRDAQTEILFMNQDTGAGGAELRQGLLDTGYFDLVEALDGTPLTLVALRDAVADGRFQVGVVIPEGVSGTVKQRADAKVDAALGGEGEAFEGDDQPPAAEVGGTEADATPVQIGAYFDPALGNAYRRSLVNALLRLSQGLEMRSIVGAIERAMASETSDEPGDRIDWKPGDIIEVAENFVGGLPSAVVPTSVQQNVPAWTLFAMFMIVIPLSGSIVRERDLGTLVRLQTLPVRYGTLLSSKVAVYVVVCMAQFATMLFMGVVVMPWMGTPELELGVNHGAIVVAALASALAATAFGIMVGTIARTSEQGSVFGSTFVVIASALGGIMIPTFLMPAPMRLISSYSPLNWGLNAFLDIFLRGGGLVMIATDVLRLLAFAGGAMAVAVLFSLRRE